MNDDCKMANKNENTADRILNQDADQTQRTSSCRQQYFSIAETAEITGLSEKHIRRATNQGTLPCSNVGGTGRPTYRIAICDIDAWMSSTKIVTGPTKGQRQEKVNRYFGKPKRTRTSKLSANA